MSFQVLPCVELGSGGETVRSAAGLPALLPAVVRHMHAQVQIVIVKKTDLTDEYTDYKKIAKISSP